MKLKVIVGKVIRCEPGEISWKAREKWEDATVEELRQAQITAYF